jgi:hypothetical protein
VEAPVFEVEVDGAFAHPEVLVSPLIHGLFEVAEKAQNLRAVCTCVQVFRIGIRMRR